MRSTKPVFSRSSADSQRIVHREKVAKVTTVNGGIFSILNQMSINPGLSGSFPWLSNEAEGWESYRFNRLRYIFVPSSGTLQAGNIIMGPDYDASDAPPQGETQFSSYQDVEEGNVWARFACELNPDRLHGGLTNKYIRSGSLQANQDVKMYDSGTFFVACADNVDINYGKLWVEYDVTLINPQVPNGGFPAVAWVAGTTGLASATPFGAAPFSVGGNIQLGIVGGFQASLQGLVPGTELCIAQAFTGTTIANCDQTTPSGMSLKSTLASDCFNGAATQAAAVYTYTVTNEVASVNINVTAATLTSSELVVTVLTPQPSF